MAQIRKRGKAWYSDFRQNGRRVRIRLSTDKTVAAQKLGVLLDDAESGVQKNLPWPMFRDRFLAYSRAAKAKGSTVREMAAISAYERIEKPRILSDVTSESLERFKGSRRQENRGHATINKDLVVIKSMMRKAVEWGCLKAWDGKSVKKLKEAQGRLLFYSPEELSRLLGVCRSRFSAFYDWETICLLGCRAGLRRSEIYWISWKDVDLERKVLSVHPKHGWQPKTGESRHVPIADDLFKHLRAVKRRSEWVIGERPSLAVMSAFFRKISRKANLAGNIHTLRHTFASHLAQAGVPLYTISKLMGHNIIRTTMLYAHLSPENLRDAVGRLPSL